MKKFVKGFCVFLLGAVILTGCQSATENGASESSSSESSSVEESKAATIQTTIKIENDGKEESSKTLEVEEGTSLMDVLKDNFEVETSKEGFITAIDGTKQDDSKGYYWTFTLNGEWGEKGAADTILKDKDEVVFSYGKA